MSESSASILVTGGAGYIGSHTVRLLAGLGRRVVVLDNLVFGHEKAIVDDGVELVRQRIHNQLQCVKRLFQYCVHGLSPLGAPHISYVMLFPFN
jgi:UDP-glucose 4-epimerase